MTTYEFATQNWELRCAIYFHHSLWIHTTWLAWSAGGALVFGGLYPAMFLVPFRFSWIWHGMFQEQVLELLLMAKRNPKVVCKHEGDSTHVKWCCDLFCFLNPIDILAHEVARVASSDLPFMTTFSRACFMNQQNFSTSWATSSSRFGFPQDVLHFSTEPLGKEMCFQNQEVVSSMRIPAHFFSREGIQMIFLKPKKI